ncbi:hypothetical protein E0H99_10435 [Flavobacterium sp. GT3P67]|nr:hypothetical protein E0H99_10435 [Flavobacterium sp. GT3P67]
MMEKYLLLSRNRPKRPKNMATANKEVPIAGVPCFADTFVVGGSSVLRMKFSAKTPRHRTPPDRWWSGKQNSTI